MTALKWFFSSLEAKDWITLIAAVFSMVSALSAAYSANQSRRITSATLEKLAQDEASEVDLRFSRDEIAGSWKPVGNDPKSPTISSSPVIELRNFGPKTAKNIHVVFDLDTQVPDQFGGQTGVREPQQQPTPAGGPRRFRFGSGRDEFFITHVDNYGNSLPAWIVRRSRHEEIDAADFVIADAGVEVSVPEDIRNEIMLYLFFEYLLRYTNNQAGIPPQLRAPVLTVTVSWLFQDGKTRRQAKKSWSLANPQLECQVEGHTEFFSLVNAVDGDIPNGGLNPQWTTLKFGGRLKRDRSLS